MKRFPSWIYHYIAAVIAIVINICYDLHYIMMSVLTIFYMSYVYSDYKQTRRMRELIGDFSFEGNYVIKRFKTVGQLTVFWIFLHSIVIGGTHVLSYYTNYYYGVIILTWLTASSLFVVMTNNQIIKLGFEEHNK